MPSANKTPLGLNQWQANEYPKMADFNEDNRIIDEKITELQSGSGVKIYTVEELTDPAEGKIYNVKIEENTSTINEKPVYKENTTQSVTLKAGKVATVYFSGGNFFYKASASGNAVAENVLADKKFSNDDDTDIAGKMVNHGAKIFKPSTANIIIPKGFHDGTGYVEGDPDLVAGNIVSGKQIFGVNGNAEIITTGQKEALANALTSKGVPTSTNASLQTMLNNLNNIKALSNGLSGYSVYLRAKSSKKYSDKVYTCTFNIPANTLFYMKHSRIKDDKWASEPSYFPEQFISGITSLFDRPIVCLEDYTGKNSYFVLAYTNASTQSMNIDGTTGMTIYVLYSPVKVTN